MLGCKCGAETKARADHHLQPCPCGIQDAKGVCHGAGKTVSFSKILLTGLMPLSMYFNCFGLSASLHKSGHLSWGFRECDLLKFPAGISRPL